MGNEKRNGTQSRERLSILYKLIIALLGGALHFAYCLFFLCLSGFGTVLGWIGKRGGGWWATGDGRTLGRTGNDGVPENE